MILQKQTLVPNQFDQIGTQLQRQKPPTSNFQIELLPLQIVLANLLLQKTLRSQQNLFVSRLVQHWLLLLLRLLSMYFVLIALRQQLHWVLNGLLLP